MTNNPYNHKPTITSLILATTTNNRVSCFCGICVYWNKPFLIHFILYSAVTRVRRTTVTLDQNVL